MSAVILHGGRLYKGGRLAAADVLIEDGKIARVAPQIKAEQAQRVDVSGLVLAPGFIDLHAHLREPGFSYKETIRTGTRAAAAGGFTTVCAMPNLNPVPDNRFALGEELALIERDAAIEVLPYASITRAEEGDALSDIEALVQDCAGFSDDGKGVQSAMIMEAAMRRIQSVEGLLCAHCEDEALLFAGGCVHTGDVAQRFGVEGIPDISEWKQVQRDLALVEKTGVRYHICHISSAETVALLREAKAKGLPVSGECTPHQLLLCEDDIVENDGRFKMNPPLRARADRDAIRAGLLDGTIDCIATDHAPHTLEEKSRGLAGSAFGVVGLETAFAVCYTALVQPGLCTLEALLSKMIEKPARILGREAALAEGAPANLVALDTEAAWRVDPQRFYSMGRSTPFEGLMLRGQVAATWYQGDKAYSREDEV